MCEVIDIRYRKERLIKSARLKLVEGDDEVEIILSIEGEIVHKKADNFFDALIETRKELEEKNISLLCKGCCKNVYPSGMISTMGAGRKAYVLHLGKQAKMDELVDIFDSCLSEECASIEQQENYFEQWIESLR